jgi:hypothetical protein
LRDGNGNDIMKTINMDISYSKYASTGSEDDLIISALITLSPNRIVIHCENNCNNKELIETIKNVFEHRVSFCNSCEFCNIYNSNFSKV